MTQRDLQSQDVAPGATARFARILPLAFITYSLAYLDRVNVGYVGTGGIQATLGWKEWQFTVFNASFFVGYVLFQIPGTGYAARGNVKKLMFWALLFWGVIASATALLHTYSLLLIDRFLLGAVEGVVFPSLLVFLTHWFTRRERSKANTLLILGNPITMLLGSMLSGGLVSYFNHHTFMKFAGWQMMLLAEGVPTLAWAAIWWMLAKDWPDQADWMSPVEAKAVQSVLRDEQRHVKQTKDYWTAFRDPQVIMLCLVFFAWSVGIYGLNMWLPLITQQGSKMGIGSVGLLNAIPYLFGAVVMLVISAISDRMLVRQPFVWPCLLIGALAFFGSYLAGPNHFWLAFLGIIIAATCMYAPYGPFWAMVPERVSRNVIGESLALINTIGAAGGFLGTLGVGELHRRTGGYGATFACLSICLAVAGLLTLAIRKPHENETQRGFPVIIPAEAS